MRIGILFLIIIALPFLVGCPPPNGSVGSPGSEMGDAVFRSLSKWDLGGTKTAVIGHAALYRNSNGQNDWDPDESMINSDLKHSVIQATGEGTELGWQTFEFFLNDLEQNEKGYTTSPQPLTVAARRRLVEHAKEQYGAAYPQCFEEWYYPKIMTPNSATEMGCFRCDGLVEYVYEQEGRGFFDEDKKKKCFFWDESGWIGFPEFFPEALRREMRLEQPKIPELEIINPQDDAVVEPQTVIKIKTNDGPYGSGIDRVEIHINDVLIHMDDVDEDGEKTVQYTWDTQGLESGSHKLKAISYDRAGNKVEKELSVRK
jgi:hypothetical protein